MTGREWTFAEDGALIGAYIDGAGWEERAAERLEGRTPEACEERGGILHLRSTAWMRAEMRRFFAGCTRASLSASRQPAKRMGMTPHDD